MEIKPNAVAMEILAYLAYETVAQVREQPGWAIANRHELVTLGYTKWAKRVNWIPTCPSVCSIDKCILYHSHPSDNAQLEMFSNRGEWSPAWALFKSKLKPHTLLCDLWQHAEAHSSRLHNWIKKQDFLENKTSPLCQAKPSWVDKSLYKFTEVEKRGSLG